MFASVLTLMKQLKPKNEDFSTFLSDAEPTTKKQALLEECKKHNVSPYIADASETSSGVYAQFRGVASEAELEGRINAKKALDLANRANLVAIIALLISIVALIKSFL
jgi:hypothetical protein